MAVSLTVLKRSIIIFILCEFDKVEKDADLNSLNLIFK
jgi:hypothetical protein